MLNWVSGVMFMELSQNLRALVAGTESYKMRLYVGHDGSMIRLASGLGMGNQAPLKWPALGSEIVIEVRVAPFWTVARLVPHRYCKCNRRRWFSLAFFMLLTSSVGLGDARIQRC